MPDLLSHLSAKKTFMHLRQAGCYAKNLSWEAWRDATIERYRARKKLGPADEAVERVAFSIRNGRVSKDGQEHGPFIVHEVLLPDEALKRDLKAVAAIDWDDENELYDGLRVRIVVVNGVLKLQLGKWAEPYGREVRSGRWIAWDTITSFPLLLNYHEHYIPARFLLVDIQERSGTVPGWPSTRAWWRAVRDYERVVALAGEWGEQRAKARLEDQLNAWTKRDGFSAGLGASWRNSVMAISFECFRDGGSLVRWLGDMECRY
jgi:hypothetical protein